MKAILLTFILITAIILFEKPETIPVKFESSPMHLSISDMDRAFAQRWTNIFKHRCGK